MDQREDSSRQPSMMNQSMVSESNRYSKYLDQEDVEVEIVDQSQIRAAGA